MSSVNFCTCVDYECPMNPVNHDKGCTPCIAQNLKEQHIPVCFFRDLRPDMDRKQDYSYKGFARFQEQNPPKELEQ